MGDLFGGATAVPNPERLKKKPGQEIETNVYITVGIPESDIWDDPDAEGDPSVTGTKKKTSWLKRKMDPTYDKGGQKTRPVRMLKSDFVKYFLKDQKTGKYREGVVEPPEGRKQFLQDLISDYRNGELDGQAYEQRNYEDDYKDFHRKSTVGKALDFVGQPALPWAGKPIK